jgi:methionine salvage enolase-phosphatase E1
MTEENKPEPLDDIIESDQAVEPDAKVADELRILPENNEGIKIEEIVTAHATVKEPLLKYMMRKKRQTLQREEIILINISKQLDKQTAEIEKMSSVLQSIQKYIKPLRRQRPELMKQLQSQIKEIQKQTSQVQRSIIKRKRRK